MKLLVSCDQVFEVLTRGPFPAGHDSDDAVEQHLRACHECRQLAAALQPAVALLHESLAAPETDDLPAYQGRLFDAPPANRRVRPMLEKLGSNAKEHQQTPPWQEHPVAPAAAKGWSAARRCALATLAGALVVLVWGFAGSLERSQENQPPLAAGPLHQPTAQGLAQLASLKLPAECFPIHFDLSQSVAETAPTHSPQPPATPVAHVCCTRCHAESQARQPAMRDFATLRASCSACHEST